MPGSERGQWRVNSAILKFWRYTVARRPRDTRFPIIGFREWRYHQDSHGIASAMHLKKTIRTLFLPLRLPSALFRGNQDLEQGKQVWLPFFDPNIFSFVGGRTSRLRSCTLAVDPIPRTGYRRGTCIWAMS